MESDVGRSPTDGDFQADHVICRSLGVLFGALACVSARPAPISKRGARVRFMSRVNGNYRRRLIIPRARATLVSNNPLVDYNRHDGQRAVAQLPARPLLYSAR